MREWSLVQKIIDDSVPRVALEKLCAMEREISSEISQAIDYRSRLQQRIKSISSALGEESYFHVGEDLTTRQKIINILHNSDRPLSTKEISTLIPGVEYTKIWRYITVGYQGHKALVKEEFVIVQGEGRMRRYAMRSINRVRK